MLINSCTCYFTRVNRVFWRSVNRLLFFKFRTRLFWRQRTRAHVQNCHFIRFATATPTHIQCDINDKTTTFGRPASRCRYLHGRFDRSYSADKTVRFFIHSPDHTPAAALNRKTVLSSEMTTMTIIRRWYTATSEMHVRDKF